MGAQNAFWSNKCTSGAKDRARGRGCIDEKLGSPNISNIGAFGAPKAHLAPNGARLAGWPAGQPAGWLAEAEAEDMWI